MENTMKVAVMTDLKKMAFERRPIPQPCDHEVLVKLEYVGICGSDVHYYEFGRIADQIVTTPFVLGHEAAGAIVAVGNAVTHLQVGDRVALESGVSCGVCEFCRSGRYNLCPHMVFFATPPIDGVFQEYVAHDASLCFKLPDSMTTMEGALIEPLAVGFHAANLCEAHVGQTAVVTGAGCIGLVTLLALKARGVSRVYLVDVIKSRLEKALALGADGVIDATCQNAVEEVMKRTEGRGCDILVETAGAQITSEQSIYMVKKGAMIVFVGFNPSGKITLPMDIALNKELTMKTLCRYRNIYPMAIETVATGKIDLKSIVTNIYDFDQIAEAMEFCINNKADIIKAVIKF